VAIEVRAGTEGKVCSSCCKWKPLTDFYKDSSQLPSQGGRHCRCKPCFKGGRKAQAARAVVLLAFVFLSASVALQQHSPVERRKVANVTSERGGAVVVPIGGAGIFSM
jgi:hypothetical protein